MPYIKKLPVSIFIILLWVFVALALCLIVPTIQGTYDYQYSNTILGIFRRALVCIFLALLVRNVTYTDEVIEEFMLYYVCANTLYVISTIIFILFPSLRSFWVSILHLNQKSQNLLLSYGYAGRFGWSGFSGFRNTIDCTLSIVFCTYLYAGVKSKKKLSTFQYVLLALFCFIGNMFYGRTGVLVSSACLLFGLTMYRKLRFKLIIQVLFVVLFAIVFIAYFRGHIEAVDQWYRWVSAPFINLIRTGSFKNSSADRLFNEMIFMPEAKTFLFGDARYVDPATGLYYMHTDAGFMRQILFWGVILTTVMYVVWLFSIMCMKRDMVFKLMCLVMCIIFEIKGETYYELLPLFAIIAAIDKTSKHSGKIPNRMVLSDV